MRAEVLDTHGTRRWPERRHAGHTARWLPDGDAAYAEMERAIEQARESVRLESYLVRAKGPAQRLRAALLRASRRGVRVCVLIDAYGSEDLPQDFFRELADGGGEVRVFNPSRLLRLSFRNHRKLLLCDDRSAIVGGFNIGPEYAGDGVVRGWRDLGLVLTGPVVAALSRSFDQMFALAPFNAAAIRAFRAASAANPREESSVRLLTSGPGCPPHRLRRALHRDMRYARSVTVMAAYFLPSSRIRRELKRCARRGGRARLLLAGPTDVPLSKLASEHLYPKLLAHGIAVHEYQPQVLHAKLLVIDDVVYVGSCNLDRRSLHINYELLVRLEWPELAADARRMFVDDLRHSVRLAPTWSASRGWWQRLRSRLAYWLLARVDPLIARRKLRTLA